MGHFLTMGEGLIGEGILFTCMAQQRTLSPYCKGVSIANYYFDRTLLFGVLGNAAKTAHFSWAKKEHKSHNGMIGICVKHTRPLRGTEQAEDTAHSAQRNVKGQQEN